MSGPITTARATQHALLNTLRDLLDGGSIEIYDGTPPATPDTPIGAQTLLATLTLANPSAPNASGGALVLNPITGDPSAEANGTAAWARIRDAGANPVIDTPVGTVGSGVGLELDTTTLEVGKPVAVQSGRFVLVG